MQCLIDNGAQIEAKTTDGWTHLYFAVNQGNVDIVKLLVEKGANIETKLEDGFTPLHFAADSET